MSKQKSKLGTYVSIGTSLFGVLGIARRRAAHGAVRARMKHLRGTPP